MLLHLFNSKACQFNGCSSDNRHKQAHWGISAINSRISVYFCILMTSQTFTDITITHLPSKFKVQMHSNFVLRFARYGHYNRCQCNNCTNGSFRNQPTTSFQKRRCRQINVVLQDATNVDLCKRRCTERIADEVQRCAPRGNSMEQKCTEVTQHCKEGCKHCNFQVENGDGAAQYAADVSGISPKSIRQWPTT